MHSSLTASLADVEKGILSNNDDHILFSGVEEEDENNMALLDGIEKARFLSLSPPPESSHQPQTCAHLSTHTLTSSVFLFFTSFSPQIRTLTTQHTPSFEEELKRKREIT